MKSLLLRLKLGILIVALASVSGCQFDPYADDYTRSKPKKSDLIGTYFLSGQTLNNTPIEQLKARDGSSPSPHKLILRSDGTFSILNMPMWVGNWANGSSDEWSISKFKSGFGKWDVQVVGSVGEGSGKVVDVWGLDFSSANISIGSVTLSGEKPPYSIIFGYGDPDGGDAMTYEK